MSDEFLRVARQEIQSEIDNLNKIFLSCVNDEQLRNRSVEIARHMHKIKGLAPMMGQEKMGEIAKISDMVVKHISSHGILKGAQGIILDAIKRMSSLCNGQTDIQVDDFKKHVMSTWPDIFEF
ncbi:MAG: Hpt domain-containing protein [Thaumarchaeota archaeon]|nr:Hpt domain-containing protein [Nitrososphaerota archaeon]MDE1830754.1 Hpt domain-containing protein [Nitrososphaerota archaeon]MDE1840804.1 Hpt domain-containing protein [Nitrososphaerota archaeon]MDE1877020.1 Hpt domain-containing protein [Nitrososphaerota archaeon]